MKFIPLLLGVSLVANAALLVVVYRPVQSSPFTSAPASASTPSAVISSAGPSTAHDESAAAAKTADQSSAERFVSWPKLHSATLADMVAAMRSAGFPPSAIRAMVYARLNEQMAGKRKELFSGLEDTPFWKVKRPMFDSKIMMAQREFYQEQRKLAKEVLGPDAVEHNDWAEYFRKRQYGDISFEKEEKLQQVQGDYSDLTNSIYAEANGLIVPEDREKLAYLEKEMRHDLAEVLTPTELENYELRSSQTANQLRGQLTTFQPTEAEFRALFNASRAIAEKFGDNPMGQTSDQRQQRTAAMNEQAKLALSAERFAQFEQATNPANQMLNRVVARYNLPETVVPQVNAVQKDIQQRATAMRQLPAAEQTLQAQALQKEATSKLKPLLGENAYQAYKVYGGQWLDQITRPPTGAPATSPPAGGPKTVSRG